MLNASTCRSWSCVRSYADRNEEDSRPPRSPPITLTGLTGPQSPRIAITGLTLVARQAGTKLASSPTTSRTTATPA